MDFKPLNSESSECIINDCRDFRLVHNIEGTIPYDIDICLIKLPEASSLRPFSTVDLTDLITAERKRELAVMCSNIFSQRHREVKSQSEITVSFCKAVDLLLCFPAAFSEQNFCRLNHGRVKGGEAIFGIRIPEHCHHALHFHLICRKQLHKAGKGPGCHFCHRFSVLLFFQVLVLGL